MPTGTWERLPPERRAAVTAAAEHEFAERGFSGGSLNSIAREAGVSKGSLFQYFDDKVDLFAYLAGLASVRIRDAMAEVASGLPWQRDFFGALRELSVAWVGYFYEHPTDLALTAAANLEPDRATRAAVRDAAAEHYLGMLRPLVDLAASTGQLREGADREALLALLLLVIPHVALAPHVLGLDAVMGFEATSPAEAAQLADRLLAVLEAAYSPLS